VTVFNVGPTGHLSLLYPDAAPAEVRMYNPLFTKPAPTGGEGFADDLNPNSLEVLGDARTERDSERSLFTTDRAKSYPAPDGKLTFDKLSSVYVNADGRHGRYRNP